MTEQEYETAAEAIALTIWEATTGNGQRLDEGLWDSHMTNCHTAVANTYYDDIDIVEWMNAATDGIGGAA